MARSISCDPVLRRQVNGAEVGRFALTGGLAYLIDVAVFNAALLAGTNHLAAKVISSIAAIAVAYLGSRYYTWPATRPSTTHPILVFVAVSAVAASVQLGCLWLSHDVLGLTSLLADNVSANAVGMGMATAIRFWGFRRFVFDPTSRERNETRHASPLSDSVDRSAPVSDASPDRSGCSVRVARPRRERVDPMATGTIRPSGDAATVAGPAVGVTVQIEEGTRMRVLVVEDEAQLADTVRRGLNAEGFNVEVAVNGQDGLWAATESAFDVIVLDIMLPKLNGYQVVEQLRQRGVWTPILMLTAKDGEYDQADAFDLGADDYLTKPFSFIVLVARLHALIRRGAPARPVVLSAGDLQLDPARRSVRRGETVIRLTPREFGLLEYLMQHRGDVMSKTEILESVWDPFYEGDPNVVEVYVGYLRRKVDTPFGRHAIQTVRGMGYRLDVDGG